MNKVGQRKVPFLVRLTKIKNEEVLLPVRLRAKLEWLLDQKCNQNTISCPILDPRSIKHEDILIPNIFVETGIILYPQFHQCKSWILRKFEIFFFTNPLSDPDVISDIGCDNQEKCRCDISVDIRKDKSGTPLTAGTYDSLDFEVTITNSGEEPAYRVKLELESNIKILDPDQLISLDDIACYREGMFDVSNRFSWSPATFFRSDEIYYGHFLWYI